MSKSVLEKKEDKEESESEHLKGEIMEDAIKASLKLEENIAHDALDRDSNWSSGHFSEESVPPVVESTKAPEDAVPDKVTDAIDSKMVKNKSPHEEKREPQRKISPSSVKETTTPKEELSDNDLPNSVVGEASEESVSESLSPNTSSLLDDQGEEAVPDSQENPATITLFQSSPVVAELEDNQHT